MKKSILAIVFVSLSNVMLGQVYEAGFFVGGSNYVGDIGRTNYIYPNEIAGAVFFKYNWNPKMAVRATYSYLPVSGNDLEADTDFRRDRGFSFSNTIHEFALGLEYNFYEYDLSSVDKTWTPYLLIELAGFNYQYAVAEPRPNDFTFESGNNIALPFGLGFKSKLIGNFAFAIEAKFRYTFLDDIDNTSSNIPRLDFGNNTNDWYMFTGVSLTYTFGRPACYTKGL